MTPYRSISLLGLLGLCVWGVGMAMNPIHSEPPADPQALKTFAEQTNQFGWDLFQQLRRQPGNLFFSPYSVSSALAMTSVGARGQTAAQMTKVMHLPGEASTYSGLHQGLMSSLLNAPKGYEIRIANALWGQNKYSFKDEYVQLVQRNYRAEGRTLDFAGSAENSRSTINRWVEQQTNDRIKDLLPSGTITPLTRLVLTNAIYFKGTWSTPFDKKLTKPLDFSLTADQTVKADMMWRSGSFRYTEDEQMQLLELPYQGDRLTMIVVLPRKKDGLSEVEATLNQDKIAKQLNGMKSTKVVLTLPKIKTTYATSLVDTLSSMGMTDVFDQGKADLSGMDGTRELFISTVVHKAFCEINEEGTEAAAATGAVVTLKSMPAKEPPPIEFKADHPYLYMIRDTQTGSLLFLGRVADPRN